MKKSLVLTLLLAAVLCAISWSVSAPKGHTPYASAMQAVTVKSAHAGQCDQRCGGDPLFPVCVSTTELIHCAPVGGHCYDYGCIE